MILLALFIALWLVLFAGAALGALWLDGEARGERNWARMRAELRRR